jgi:hypothetical protein
MLEDGVAPRILPKPDPKFEIAEATAFWLAEANPVEPDNLEAEGDTTAALLPTLLPPTPETDEEASPRILGTLRLVARLMRGVGEFTTVDLVIVARV